MISRRQRDSGSWLRMRQAGIVSWTTSCSIPGTGCGTLESTESSVSVGSWASVIDKAPFKRPWPQESARLLVQSSADQPGCTPLFSISGRIELVLAPSETVALPWQCGMRKSLSVVTCWNHGLTRTSASAHHAPHKKHASRSVAQYCALGRQKRGSSQLSTETKKEFQTPAVINLDQVFPNAFCQPTCPHYVLSRRSISLDQSTSGYKSSASGCCVMQCKPFLCPHKRGRAWQLWAASCGAGAARGKRTLLLPLPQPPLRPVQCRQCLALTALLSNCSAQPCGPVRPRRLTALTP